MRLIITNETGMELFAIYPNETEQQNDKFFLRIDLSLTEVTPPAGCRAKKLAELPLCGSTDFPELELGMLRVRVIPPADWQIKREDGFLTDEADGTKCHMVRLLKISPKSVSN